MKIISLDLLENNDNGVVYNVTYTEVKFKIFRFKTIKYQSKVFMPKFNLGSDRFLACYPTRADNGQIFGGIILNHSLKQMMLIDLESKTPIFKSNLINIIA
mgnify:CR=1 FL=1